MALITKTDYEIRRQISLTKKVFRRLHKNHELCIITLRPPPRWAKWSRGVRTRGLRVGLVGGPRPLLFLDVLFSSLFLPLKPASQLSRIRSLTFKRSGLIYGTDKT